MKPSEKTTHWIALGLMTLAWLLTFHWAETSTRREIRMSFILESTTHMAQYLETDYKNCVDVLNNIN